MQVDVYFDCFTHNCLNCCIGFIDFSSSKPISRPFDEWFSGSISGAKYGFGEQIGEANFGLTDRSFLIRYFFFCFFDTGLMVAAFTFATDRFKFLIYACCLIEDMLRTETLLGNKLWLVE